MATPNLINVDTITPTVVVGAVTTSRVAVVDVTAEYCAKVNSVIIANIDGTNAATVNIEVSTDGAGSGSFFHVAKTVQVPADSSLILDKPVNLFNTNNASAGDLMRATASAASRLEAFISILEIS